VATMLRENEERRAAEMPAFFRGATRRRPALPPAPFLVAGLGVAGRAAAEALVARAGGSAVRVWDETGDPPQRARADELRALGVECLLGDDGRAALAGARTVVKSPGVPWDAPPVAEALRRGVPVVDELEIGWRLVPAPTVAVTGTNGKTTVAGLLVSVLAAHGLAPALTGNTAFGPPLSALSLGPPPRSLVAEVSSYQAEASPELAADAAIFTNLSNDHLNRHGTMAAYAYAKRALFVKGEWAVPVAALNVDDELGRELAGEVEERGGWVLRCGQGRDADYRIADCRWDLRAAELTIEAPDGPVVLETTLPGVHNAANVTSVLALADGLGLPRERTLEALASAPPVPGRFELVEVDRPFDVVVDFAYSVGAVSAVLRAARAVATARGGRLIAVAAIVGRNGVDTGREVGAAARAGSDHLILSGTSYRGEPRVPTLAALAAGARGVGGGTFELVIDRREAIARALAAAGPGDVVVVLGRGSTGWEATDARGGAYRLDDREAVRELAG